MDYRVATCPPNQSLPAPDAGLLIVKPMTCQNWHVRIARILTDFAQISLLLVTHAETVH
jgi:hypothetical protein